MIIRVHIDRLVLDGVPIDKAQGPAIGAAVQAELARLIAEKADVSGFPIEGADRLQGPAIEVRGGEVAHAFGARIAGSAYGSLAT